MVVSIMLCWLNSTWHTYVEFYTQPLLCDELWNLTIRHTRTSTGRWTHYQDHHGVFSFRSLDYPDPWSFSTDLCHLNNNVSWWELLLFQWRRHQSSCLRMLIMFCWKGIDEAMVNTFPISLLKPICNSVRIKSQTDWDHLYNNSIKVNNSIWLCFIIIKTIR